VTENTRRGARGFILPAPTRPGNPAENTLLGDTINELDRLDIRRGSWSATAASKPTRPATPSPTPRACSSPDATNPGRVAPANAKPATAPASTAASRHLKRGYGLRRSRLKGHDGQQTWTGWSILTYNLDTLAIRTG
jgi:hypothetical protein